MGKSGNFIIKISGKEKAIEKILKELNFENCICVDFEQNKNEVVVTGGYLDTFKENFLDFNDIKALTASSLTKFDITACNLLKEEYIFLSGLTIYQCVSIA